MWGWFAGGGSAQARKEAPKKAILALRQQLDMLQKREKHLENQMAEQEGIARKNVSSNKTGKFVSYRMCLKCIKSPVRYLYVVELLGP